MNAIQNTQIQFGAVDPELNFQPDCIAGDWRTWVLNQVFQPPFQSDNVRVIVTANNKNVDPALHNPAVVGVVAAVDRNGFTLSARNSDCDPGEAGFYFMAVEEVGTPPGVEPADLRLGILQRRLFREDCQPGDWLGWSPRFSDPFPPGKEVAALVTGCNLNVPAASFNVPAVGISRNLNINGFNLAARNSADCHEGECAFYWVAGVNQHPPKDDFWIDSGVVGARGAKFARSCTGGWMKSWHVYFNRSFPSPPVVLLTCTAAESDPGNYSAVVGLAQDVTTHGFTLAGLSSSCAWGIVQFNWVAIGCGEGCG